MKNELRVGNLIYRIDRSNEIHMPVPIPLVVAEIKAFELSVHQIGEMLSDKEWKCIDINNASPIPLSEEILLKCGFKFIGGYFYLNNCNAIGFDLKFGFYHKGTFVKIESLHQLQNLIFALTNEELNPTL